MKRGYLAFAALPLLLSAVAVRAAETTTSTTGNSTSTITQSGGGATTKQVIKGKNSQTIIQQQGGNSAVVHQNSGESVLDGGASGRCVEAAGVSVCPSASTGSGANTPAPDTATAPEGATPNTADADPAGPDMVASTEVEICENRWQRCVWDSDELEERCYERCSAEFDVEPCDADCADARLDYVEFCSDKRASCVRHERKDHRSDEGVDDLIDKLLDLAPMVRP